MAEGDDIKVPAWRLHVLLEAGYDLADAEKIAERWRGQEAIDLHQAVELVTVRGCSSAAAVEILI
jgi:hypothetical protein